MPYLIDTDWVIDHLENLPEAIELLARLAEEGIAISIITYMEAYQGIARSAKSREAHAKFEAFVGGLPVLPLSPEVAKRCAILRETLRKQGKRVTARALDLIIAATALKYSLTLVTRNLDDYRDIPDLKLL